MIIAINYADKSFQKAQKLNLETAKKWGADRTIAYMPEDMDTAFRERNQAILSAIKGNGFYLWKPYFLNKAYQELKEGDYLIYTDAGSIYVNKIQYLIDCMEQEKMEWNKRYAHDEMFQAVVEPYSIKGIPHMVLIDPQGKIAYVGHNALLLTSVLDNI